MGWGGSESEIEREGEEKRDILKQTEKSQRRQHNFQQALFHLPTPTPLTPFLFASHL